VKAKWDALVAMLLDWLYNISTLVTIHSPSPIDDLKSKDPKRSNVKASSLGVKILGLGVVDVGVGILELGMGMPSFMYINIFYKKNLEACTHLLFSYTCSIISSPSSLQFFIFYF